MDNGACSYRRFLDGDDKGLEEIVRDYKDGLIFFLSGYTGSLYEAEDLMQETFFKLITRKPRFKEKYSFKTWLYTIARNTAVDSLRHRKALTELPLEDAETEQRDEQDLERSFLLEERKIAVHRALKELNPEYRRILWLVFFEDLSHDEAAAVMKKNARQISNLVYRAKSALRSELEKEGFEYEDLS